MAQCWREMQPASLRWLAYRRRGKLAEIWRILSSLMQRPSWRGVAAYRQKGAEWRKPG